MTDSGPDSTLSTYTASDGDNLAVQDWPLPEGTRPRGAVIIVHGLGEHAGRYDPVARRFNRWGFQVRGYDQYGHGESGGVRGALPGDLRFVEDLADLVVATRRRLPNRTPLLLLGHSMGGLVAASFVARRMLPVEGLVLSSPALGMHLNAVQRALLAIVPRIAPNLTLGNGLDPQFLSHDPEVVAAYRADPLVHDRISGRLARFLAQEGPRVLAQAPHWPLRTLLLYAGADRLVDPAGSDAFAARAPRQQVTVQRFDTLYHEIFNELEAQPVFAALQAWLDAQFPGR